MDLYEILQVEPNCSINDIKKSYYKLAKIYHPDKVNGDTETFQKINNAYNILNNEVSRKQYNMMNHTTKNKFMLFLEKWFKDQTSYKKFFNFSDEILNNIDYYDFTDIIKLFTESIIPTTKYNTSIDCSDSDMDSWDETQAEYYNILPIKYNLYNKYDIYLELKVTLNEIISNKVRKIKIKRKDIDTIYTTTFNFNCNYPYVVYCMGGDSSSNTTGNLIILLKLPDDYTWTSNNIIYNININLYQYIYGLDIKLNFNNKSYEVNSWIPYRDGITIDITDLHGINFLVLLNLQYTDSSDKRKLLEYFKS